EVCLVLAEVSDDGGQVGLAHYGDVRRRPQGALDHVLGNAPTHGTVRDLAGTRGALDGYGGSVRGIVLNVVRRDPATAAAPLNVGHVDSVSPNELPDCGASEGSLCPDGRRWGCRCPFSHPVPPAPLLA